MNMCTSFPDKIHQQCANELRDSFSHDFQLQSLTRNKTFALQRKSKQEYKNRIEVKMLTNKMLSLKKCYQKSFENKHLRSTLQQGLLFPCLRDSATCEAAR